MDWSPYRASVRLLDLAAYYWSSIDAHYYQIDVLELPIYRQFNLVHSWLIRNMDEERLEMFESILTEPFDWEKRIPLVTSAQSDDEIEMMRAAAEEF